MKTDRLNAILKLIDEKCIETQDELVNELNKEGYNVTQATVSRDIRKLNLTKMSYNGKQRYVHYKDIKSGDYLNQKYIRVLREGYVSMDTACNILVIKTVAGMAMAVAAALDALQFKEIVGSIAGDDTIMCAVRSTEEANLLLTRLREIILN